MAKLTLQEQLLQAGLVSSAQAKAVKSQQQKAQKQQQKNKIVVVDETKLLVQKAQEQMLQKDRALNQQRQEQAAQKALLIQIKQLIADNLIAQEGAEIAYHFTDTRHVKTIYVTEAMREQLIKGRVAITRLDNAYVLVSGEIAQRILERDASYFVFLNAETDGSPADDPYAAYSVPDDLMW